MDIAEIERRSDISAEEFAQNHLRANRPVVLGAGFTENWRSRREWVDGGRPNFARLREIYGEAVVAVAHCDTPHLSDQKRTEMRMSDFLDRWQASSSSVEEKLYCKDFHLSKHAYDAYEVPAPLSDDWLDLFYSQHPELNDDYQFCYMGGDGTWTPFHRDVYWSYSWSANICGTKRWILVPPGQEPLFTDALNNTVYNLLDYDDTQFPRLHELHTLEVVQRAGEIVFVPSGWWHQVHNIGDTVSINRNWANEYNLPVVHAHLRSAIADVFHAFRDLAHLDDFPAIAQQALRANSAIDYAWFFDFLSSIAHVYLRALAAPASPSPLTRFAPFFSSPPSIVHALRCVSDSLDLLLHDDVTHTVDGLADKVARLHREVETATAARHGEKTPGEER
ncbi:hypothetical protein LPJ72_005487 [Coemansia sp. Benny D160-2]|nr:hypothetical protein LPJ72_005487 [Coemansia sp. Benny D160-2]